jgi:hypothetical protein
MVTYANRDNLQALLKRTPLKSNKFEFLRRIKFGMSKKKFKKKFKKKVQSASQ